jgi:hypothetical protein
MSFGSLSANAIRALNRGAKIGNFAHDTGEGGLSPYHREHGGEHYLGDRLGVFRLPQPGRHLLCRYLRQGGRSQPGEDGRAQN